MLHRYTQTPIQMRTPIQMWTPIQTVQTYYRNGINIKIEPAPREMSINSNQRHSLKSVRVCPVQGTFNPDWRYLVSIKFCLSVKQLQTMLVLRPQFVMFPLQLIVVPAKSQQLLLHRCHYIVALIEIANDFIFLTEQ